MTASQILTLSTTKVQHTTKYTHPTRTNLILDSLMGVDSISAGPFQPLYGRHHGVPVDFLMPDALFSTCRKHALVRAGRWESGKNTTKTASETKYDGKNEFYALKLV